MPGNPKTRAGGLKAIGMGLLGPMFKRIFRPKHKLFKNQPNTNIMLFIFVPSPTRPSQKKKLKNTRKSFAFVSAGYRISHIPPWFPPFMTKNRSFSKNTKSGVEFYPNWCVAHHGMNV